MSNEQNVLPIDALRAATLEYNASLAGKHFGATERIIRAYLSAVAPQAGDNAEEPVAWESTTPGYIKYVTDSRYQKFSDEVKRWYKPYRCSACQSTADLGCVWIVKGYDSDEERFEFTFATKSDFDAFIHTARIGGIEIRDIEERAITNAERARAALIPSEQKGNANHAD